MSSASPGADRSALAILLRRRRSCSEAMSRPQLHREVRRLAPGFSQAAGCRSRALQFADGGTRVPPLQAVDRGRRGARLLDDDRGGADRGFVRGLEGRVGAAARDRRRLRRPADLRVGPSDHVLARVLLLLRASAEKLPASVRLPRPRRARAAGAARRAHVNVEARQHHPRQAPGRGGAADHKLAAGSLRSP